MDSPQPVDSDTPQVGDNTSPRYSDVAISQAGTAAVSSSHVTDVSGSTESFAEVSRSQLTHLTATTEPLVTVSIAQSAAEMLAKTKAAADLVAKTQAAVEHLTKSRSADESTVITQTDGELSENSSATESEAEDMPPAESATPEATDFSYVEALESAKAEADEWGAERSADEATVATQTDGELSENSTATASEAEDTPPAENTTPKPTAFSYVDTLESAKAEADDPVITGSTTPESMAPSYVDTLGETPPDTDSVAQESQLLKGRYLIGKRIGAGGMGTILEAKDTQMDRKVALKVLHIHLAKDVVMRKRFAKEATNAATLSHQNIVAVYDQGCEDLPWIAMELVDGPSLRQVLIENGPLSPHQALSVIAPLADALNKAHSKGLVHRDIKPENVLITKDGIPKLADFGIAKLIEHTSQTDMRTLVGSVHYLAPELVQGYTATSDSDQYALAVMLFELLTNKKPLPADTPMAIALRHANEKVPYPSEFNPQVTKKLDEVVRKATSINPTDRYTTLMDFQQALYKAIPGESEPVCITAPSGSDRVLIMSVEDQTNTFLKDNPPQDGEIPSTVIHRSTVQLSRKELRERAILAGQRPAHWWQFPLPAMLLRLTRNLAVMAIIGLFVWFFIYTIVLPATPMANYVGIPVEVAKQRITSNGQLVSVTTEPAGDALPGIVLKQHPAMTEPVRPGDVVELVVANGDALFKMPDLVGQHVQTALLALQAYGCQPNIEQIKSDETAGTVVKQSVSAGKSISVDSEITLTVSQDDHTEFDLEDIDFP